jgi:phosphoglycolate phosphatase-like HAD superfamily hydrolase
MLKNKKLLIFDCDGVLIDSLGANMAYFNHCLTLAGYPAIAAQYHDRVAYMSIKQLIGDIFGDTSEGEGKRVYELSKSVSYGPFLGLIEPKFDFHAVLGRLRSRYLLAVASNRGKSLVTLFKHFNLFDYFHYKIAALGIEAKPAPDMLLACMNYFDVSAGETLFFGDAGTDYEAACAADIDFCWVGVEGCSPGIESVRNLLDMHELRQPS